MMNDSDLRKLQEALLQKVGRNLLLYQDFEQLLKKWLLKSQQRTEFQNPNPLRQLDIRKKTMGALKETFLKESFFSLELAESSPLPSIHDGPGIAISFQFGKENEAQAQYTARLQKIIDTRNKFVHHFMETYSLESPQDFQRVGELLDQERGEVLKEIEVLENYIQRIDETIKEYIPALQLLRSLLQSEEFLSLFPANDGRPLIAFFERYVQIFLFLKEFGVENAQQDGWTDIAIVEQFLRNDNPAIIEDINIRALIKESTLFDTQEIASQDGGSNTFYRWKQ